MVQSVDTSQYKVHRDLPGHETLNGGSLPRSMVVTNLKHGNRLYTVHLTQYTLFSDMEFGTNFTRTGLLNIFLPKKKRQLRQTYFCNKT